jgi:FkbM family methyltransferase
VEAVTTETLIVAGRHTGPADARSPLDEAVAKALGPDKLSAAGIEMLIRVATQQLGDGQFADAERTMERVLSEHSKSAGGDHLMSAIQERLGKIPAAIEHAETSMRIEPDDHNRLSRLGNLLLAADRPVDAEVAFRRLIVLKPAVTEYHVRLATSLEQQNRYDDAMNALQAAIKLEPASVPLTTGMQAVQSRKEAFTAVSTLIRSVDPVTLKLLPRNFGHLMFSQFGEDGVLWQLFRLIRDGFYVDIGANHPLRLSNTALLHSYNGWSGINVDADQRYIDEFNIQRPNDVNICCGVGAAAGTAVMGIFADGAVNSFDPAEIHKSQTKGRRQVVERREVRIRTLVDILDSYLPSGRQVDLLNVDAEGWDTAILGANDWSKYRPKVILVEDHTMTLNHVERSATYALLRAKGYDLFSQTLATSFYRKAA